MTKEILTEENYKNLQRQIDKHKNKEGALIPILNEAQKIFGYVPIEVQKRVSEELKMALSEIYGVVTFYSQFTLKPRGELVIGVCLGTACYVRNAQLIVDKISDLIHVEVGETSPDGKYTLEATRCIGACGLAPVLTVNQDVYGRLTLEDIPEIISKY
ncbi:MAG: NAD(P)H-dependent oxidoreductase subunit E [Clostridiales bacterium]|nr:NAD(P)H-dependent oxidoreductase subunit E [Clostridiales bacterium]